ncbi:hypothetical protein [Leeuwenhoekiella blandensis]|uniref:Uncharacterized protein n=1 Tax=Leeuwenhoekiella blandensis (strain CECT 7118 / CCUG 51940 / KCTC 22103 / MED217) TaxID=398720 RepID=A3XLG9_LEEBM|nr:hypothetical protein [Leeuwenhoekiella blandensis]EAQ49598.1 hypothetical protein MED217_12104 [Leeuwenhoekiella blandensis MED217]
MNKQILLIYFLLSSAFSIAQETIYSLNKESIADKGIEFFEIIEKKITAKTYENKLIDNPEREKAKKEIENAKIKIDSLQGGYLTNEQKQFLVNARAGLERAIAKRTRWQDLKYAKEELDKSGFDFIQTTKKDYKLALQEAQQNLNKINDLFGNSETKIEKINSLRERMSNLRKDLGIGCIGCGEPKIPHTIRQNVPIGEIERNIRILGAKVPVSEIQGNFSLTSNSYYLIKKNHRRFLENELVSGDDVREHIYRFDIENVAEFVASNSYTLVMTDNNKRYFVQNVSIEDFATDLVKNQFQNIVNSENLVITNSNRKTFVSKNNVQCVLSDYVKMQLAQGNIDIIKQTSNSVNSYNQIYDQAIKQLDLVTKHYQAYRNRTMTESRLSTWKNDIRKLEASYKKLSDINYGKYKNDTSSDLAYEYFRNFSKQLTREQVQASSLMADMIRETKIITGI